MRASVEHQRIALEAQYGALLDVALSRCAAGRCGLFGHNDRAVESMGKQARAKYVDPEVDELLALGETIRMARERAGFIEPFELHQRLLELRNTVTANTSGEPRLARHWLDEMQK